MTSATFTEVCRFDAVTETYEISRSLTIISARFSVHSLYVQLFHIYEVVGHKIRDTQQCMNSY